MFSFIPVLLSGIYPVVLFFFSEVTASSTPLIPRAPQTQHGPQAPRNLVGEPSVHSTHYKMAVGQGECSITISEIKNSNGSFKVAVIADMGSRGFRTDPKFLPLSGHSSQLRHVFVRKSEATDVSKSNVALSPKLKDKRKVVSGNDNLIISEERSPSVITIGGEESTHAIFVKSLAECLKGVDYWFVFLSHPDADHINYLVKTFEEFKNAKLCLVAGGEWFNSHSSTEETREILSMLQKNRDRIVYFFPFEAARSSTAQVVQYLRLNNLEGTDWAKSSSFNPRQEVGGQFLDDFHGTFKNCLENIYKNLTIDMVPKVSTERSSTLYDRFWIVFDLKSDDYRRVLIESLILDKIYIWSLDYRTANNNAQSLVWSHAVEDIGWTFVYTGDAEESTFKKIESNLKSSDSSALSKKSEHLSASTNLIMMQGMHHGSKDNFSSWALEFFEPDVVCFSASNGASFPHPHLDVVTQYSNSLKEKSRKFWENYNIVGVYKFIAFQEKGKQMGYSVKAKEGSPLMMCTNTYGTIRITKEAISVVSTVPLDYIIYDAFHAYETTTELPAEFNTSDLKENRKVQKTESFWTELRNKKWVLDRESGLYKMASKDTYKLRMIKKTSGMYYFYVLIKAADQRK